MRNAVAIRPLLALVLLAGCALRFEPATPGPHLRNAVPEESFGAREGLRLGVGSFLDARSRIDRTGSRPPLQLRWYGLVRQGEIRTGDSAFLADVASGARIDAAATLARSGAFSRVRLVGVGDATALDPIRAGQVDLVLTATLEALSGAQSQDLIVSLGLVGWMRNRFGPARGSASVVYRLYDRRGLRVETAIDTHHESPGLGVAQAALDALALANERLAAQLYRQLVPHAVRRARTERVQVLDACGVGEARTARLLREASDVFEREIGTGLQPAWREWSGIPPSDDLEATLRALEAATLPADELAIAFVPLATGRVRGLRDVRFGLARQLGTRAVIGCDPQGEVRALTVIHELGHLFGAVHVRERASVMLPSAEFDGRFFDLLNRRILQLARARPIGEPLPPATARELAAVYRAAEQVSPGVDPGEIEAALRLLETQ